MKQLSKKLIIKTLKKVNPRKSDPGFFISVFVLGQGTSTISYLHTYNIACDSKLRRNLRVYRMPSLSLKLGIMIDLSSKQFVLDINSSMMCILLFMSIHFFI